MANSDLAKWYVIRTYSAYETLVKKNLESMIALHGLEDQIFDIVIPTEEDIVEKNGKRKVVERKKFHGYVYIKLIYSEHIG